jgi:hypothetical protein
MTRPIKRRTAIAVTALVAAPLAFVTTTSSPAAAGDEPVATSMAVSWQRTALRTIFAETVPTPPPPVISVYLSFTSLAVYDAAREAQRGGGTPAAAAAVAQAAHDVLWEYFPGSRANLDADLTASLAMITDGRKEDRGVAIGAAAADRMIASRVGDGRNATVVYSKPAAPGIWQPPATGMALAWLAFLKPVVDVPVVELDGPDPLGSAEYAADYNEVKRVGSTTSETTGDRTAAQTEVSRFMNVNITPVYRDALIRRLEAEPMGLIPTTRLFARIDAAQVDSFIQTWRLKYDIGFWRPFQAIAGAETDGNPDTNLHPTTWAPLITNPAYSDYASGHAAATAPFVEVLRRTLGDDTPLVLKWPGFADRSYSTLTALEHDAYMARIWGGLHFRDAMDDGYLLGRTVAHSVMRRVR